MRKLALLLLLSACTCPPIPFYPQCTYTPESCHVHSHSPTLPATSLEERVGDAFAHDRDFPNAVAAFRRAQIIDQCDCTYKILLTYYLDQKYCEALRLFRQARPRPSRDLSVILFDLGIKTCNPQLSSNSLTLLRQSDPALADKLALYAAVSSGHLAQAAHMPGAPRYFKTLLNEYCCCTKSVNQARVLNAVLPGAGYMYVGQVSTGITAILINALFIAATVQFAKHQNVPAAIIFGSLEMGWYIGGIWGAGRAAAQYNEAIYERIARKALDQERLYPILNIDYAF